MNKSEFLMVDGAISWHGQDGCRNGWKGRHIAHGRSYFGHDELEAY